MEIDSSGTRAFRPVDPKLIRAHYALGQAFEAEGQRAEGERQFKLYEKLLAQSHRLSVAKPVGPLQATPNDLVEPRRSLSVCSPFAEKPLRAWLAGPEN